MGEEEFAQRLLERRILEVRIQEGVAEVSRRNAETRSLEGATFREDTTYLLFLLAVVFILVLAVVDPQLLETIGRALPWVAKPGGAP